MGLRRRLPVEHGHRPQTEVPTHGRPLPPCSSRIAPIRRSADWILGKIPTTSDLRLISRCNRPRTFVEWVLPSAPVGTPCGRSHPLPPPTGAPRPSGTSPPGPQQPAPVAPALPLGRAGRRSSAPMPPTRGFAPRGTRPKRFRMKCPVSLSRLPSQNLRFPKGNREVGDVPALGVPTVVIAVQFVATVRNSICTI